MGKDVVIKVCTGTGGISDLGHEVFVSFQEGLSMVSGHLDYPGNLKLHEVGCKGFCARDVLVDVVIDGYITTYMGVSPDMAVRIIHEHVLGGTPVTEWTVGDEYTLFQRKQTKVVLTNCGEIDPENIHAYTHSGGYEAARKAILSLEPKEIVDEIKHSNLRGRGGAGFPTGLKWEICMRSRSDVKYVICNGDEGDPGAFMDRSIMEGDPHSVIEGMIICARAIGAHKGYIYVRAEYPLAVRRLRLAIEQCYASGLLGKNLFESGFDFDLRIFEGPGAFVCGEATALMRSIEGKRGMPIPRLSRSAEKGLWEKPTVLNNVETLSNVPHIILRGSRWFRNIGTERSGGTKVFSLSGKVKNTGLIEVPLGIPLREIIYDIGGGIEGGSGFKALQMGGPSGGCIPEQLLDTEVDYESLAQAGTMMGSGSMVVLNHSDCIVDTAKFFLNFTQSESCGKCAPCRIGTKRMLEILERITGGKGRENDIELLLELGNYIRAASLCGLGMTAPNPVLSTIRYFRSEYEAHIIDRRCPSNVCKSLLTYVILKDSCKGCGACKRVCPAGAIRGVKKKPHKIDNKLCIKCGTCFDTCKFKAILKE